MDSRVADPSFTYSRAGAVTARLVVTDGRGGEAFTDIQLVPGANMPTLAFELPTAAQIRAYRWGGTVHYRVKVVDVEDGSTPSGGIDCGQVTVQPFLGHDDHEHGKETYTGREGSFRIDPDAGSHGLGKMSYVLQASYSDRGGPGVPSLTGVGRVLFPMGATGAAAPSDSRPEARELRFHRAQGGLRVEARRAGPYDLIVSDVRGKVPHWSRAHGDALVTWAGLGRGILIVQVQDGAGRASARVTVP